MRVNKLFFLAFFSILFSSNVLAQGAPPEGGGGLIDQIADLQAQIDELYGLVADNTADIAANDGDIATNSADISSNAGAIATNAADIASNGGAIAANGADITTNTGAIATNAGDIATNAGGIATNSGDIATNATNLTNHAADASAHHSRYTDGEAIAAADPSGVLDVFSRVGDDVFMDGANLHVRNGLGTTDSTNATGNVIIGYNELRGDLTDDRSGSHMLVLGTGNNFTSYGGVVSGETNSTQAPLSSIIGGFGNVTESLIPSFTPDPTTGMTMIGGENNYSAGNRSVMIAGDTSEILESAPKAVVMAGRANSAQFGNSLIGGGRNNTIGQFLSVIVGGRDHLTGNFTGAGGQISSIFGGRSNSTLGSYSTVIGGRNNSTLGSYSTVIGGRLNNASGTFSLVAGGAGGFAPGVEENPDQHTP